MLKSTQPEQEPTGSFDTHELGTDVKVVWSKLETSMEECDDDQYTRAFADLKSVYKCLQEAPHHPSQFERFLMLVNELSQAISVSPEQALWMRLSSTRATDTSIYALDWRIRSLLTSLGAAEETKKEEGRWQEKCREQIDLFLSGVSDTVHLLDGLKSVEDRAAFLWTLKAEMEAPVGKYTPDQVEAMKKTYEEISSKLEQHDMSELAPEWFIPWYEVVVDEGDCLGQGGFGSVYRAKWLGSDVVVKRVLLSGGSHRGSSVSNSSLSDSSGWDDGQAETDTTKREKSLAMFRREVDIWFGFSHPHVVRLFGACHVGRPFFVCEYATNWPLISYLRNHPKELGPKLHEAALGVQCLHARNVAHGDLKGNTIVVGSDLKAKVTDFALSSATSSEEAMSASGAWNWAAPELFDTNKRPTLASDIYSLGMCVVEALRVVEALESGKEAGHWLPWRDADRAAVMNQATRGKLPPRPTSSRDAEWELVKRMCVLEPGKRMKISTVVDELERLAHTSTTKHEIDRISISAADALSWESAAKVIAEMQHFLAPTQDNDDDVLELYASLWEAFDEIYREIDNNRSDERCATFCSLVAVAQASTTKLRDRKGNLVSIAEATMRCHALRRKLSKLCEAYFLGGGGL